MKNNANLILLAKRLCLYLFTALGLVCLLLSCSRQPDIYKSAALVEIIQNKQRTPKPLNLEIDRISSKQVLQPVIEQTGFIYYKAKQLGIDAQTFKKDAYTALIKDLELTIDERNDQISIAIYNESPTMAAQLANAIAVSYKSLHLQLAKTKSKEYLKPYEDKLNEHREKFLTDKKKVATLSASLNHKVGKSTRAEAIKEVMAYDSAISELKTSRAIFEQSELRFQELLKKTEDTLGGGPILIVEEAQIPLESVKKTTH
ncbi:MAG: hypothetical protein AAGA18_04385 [Verrucomicrobiota bacterium]